MLNERGYEKFAFFYQCLAFISKTIQDTTSYNGIRIEIRTRSVERYHFQ